MIAERPHRKVLIVDDEPLVRETLDYCLNDEYDVTAAASGEEAIELSKQADFPVVLLDLRMDGISGLETLRRLKQLHAMQNVVILTAYESTESAIEALNLGAYSYLTKPFRQNRLKQVISRGIQDYDQNTRRTQDMQQRLMGVHDSFLSLLCHEFNTPLTSILGFSELLSDVPLTEEQKTWVGNIRSSGTHLHDILMEIVDYIGASHLASEGVKEEFTLRSLLSKAVEPLASADLAVRVEEDEMLDLRLRGATRSIQMIARKLVRIASHQSRHVLLRADVEYMPDSEVQRLTLVVQNTGLVEGRSGISRIEQLFEPYFFRPTEESTGFCKSLGLELATCRRIAEYTRGTVDCRIGRNKEIEFVATLLVDLVD
ncbi:MAG: response regulator [Verrucomicrobia bacterium]|nr:response regulator [Verrucomicrobiota bacterium]